MKLTKEFIELQGFELQKTYDKHLHAFAIENGDYLYELIWDTQNNMITIFKYAEDEVDNEIFCDNIFTCFQFIKMLVQVDEITNKGVSFPYDFVQKFYRSRFPYDKQEFIEMCEACMVLLLAKEEYESCTKLINYRKKYMEKKGWEFVEMNQSLFKSYSSMTHNAM